MASEMSKEAIKPRKRSKSPSRDSDVAAMDQGEYTQHEIEKLKRQYRIVQKEKKAGTNETHVILMRQMKAIQQLQKERDELQMTLRVATCGSQEHKDYHTYKRLELLKDQEQYYHDLLDKEMETIDGTLEERRLELDKAIVEGRRLVNKKVDAADAAELAARKRIEVLENRLNGENVRLGRTLTDNARLRNEIDHLLILRNRFVYIYDKLFRRLQECKKMIHDIVLDATQAYDERNEMQLRLLSLRAQKHEDEERSAMELKDLERLVDHDRRIRDFMTTKTQTRPVVAEVDMVTEQEKSQEERLKMFREAFERIRESSGNDDISQLVADFIASEERNFSLFNYINELNFEMESVQEQTRQIKQDIDDLNSQRTEEMETRKKQIREVELELEKVSGEFNALEEKERVYKKLLEQIIQGILNLFKTAGCGGMRDSLTGAEMDITENNMMEYLAEVEKRVHQLIKMKKRKAKAEGTTLPMTPAYPSPQPSVASSKKLTTPADGVLISAPVISGESQELDDLLNAGHPLPAEEIKKMIPKLERKQAELPLNIPKMKTRKGRF